MIIGIDIDDTMTNHCESWFTVYNEHFKPENAESLKLEDAYKWGFYDDWSEENKNLLFEALNSKHSDYYKHLKLEKNVKETIEKIINSDNQVIIISATPKELQEDKKRWLIKQMPILSEDNIIFTNNKSLINVDVMIDDKLSLAKDIKKPFLLLNKPWNTNRPPYEYTENIIKVQNWNEIEEILKEMEAITVLKSDTDEYFSEETKKLIDGIRAAQTDKECIKVLNPYIKLWQQQGMLIGLKQISDATLLVMNDVLKEMKIK